MELLVLYTLQWKMNPVTPLSFVDHIMRRFGFKADLHLEFLCRCEPFLVNAITDSRFGCYLLSILAVATMLHVIKEFEPSNVLDCQNELMDVIKMSKLHGENQTKNGRSNLDNAKCNLLNWDGTKVVVAEGTIALTDSKQLIHHVPLGPQCWKV
ncbi:unnamed protein product [Camellia sinensis]